MLSDINRIREWMQQITSEHCKDCIDTCCNGVKHKIEIMESELELFREHNIPIYNYAELRQQRAVWWYASKGLYAFTKDHVRIEKPALIQDVKDYANNCWSLYVKKYCPLYNKHTNRCEVHDDPRMPDVCKKYPFEIVTANAIADDDGRVISDETIDVFIAESCSLHDNMGVQRDFDKKFPDKKYRLKTIPLRHMLEL